MMKLDKKNCLRLLDAMKRELDRSTKGLKLKGQRRPYFLSYLLKAQQGFNLWGRYGTIFSESPWTENDLYVQCRVGSHRFDQTFDGNLDQDLSKRDSYGWMEAAKELEPRTLRYSLWRLTQLKYEEALQDYYEKKKVLVEQNLDQSLASFSREKVLRKIENIQPVTFPIVRWRNLVREISSLFAKKKRLVDPYVRVQGVNLVRLFVNSEGSRFLTQDRFYEIAISSWILAPEGHYLSAAKRFYTRSIDKLPKKKELMKAADDLEKELLELRAAPPVDPYTGPALLSGQATGLVFHEALGHRLEGKRLRSRQEGRTFANRIGTRILPEGVEVFDDPSLQDWKGQDLYGNYKIDDEGVPAQRVHLVEDGVLRHFLQSRTPIEGSKHSNGHGRMERYQNPMARMANTIVEVRDPWTPEELEQALLEETIERGLDHAILIEGVSGGETRTDHYDFQAFKGTPTKAHLIDVRSGKKKRIRDLQFIGTPLAILQRVLALGGPYEVDNSYCYAESGSVPVATIAPMMLVADLELQREAKKSYRPPILQRPPL